MTWKAVCKLLQRRSADVLSQRNGFVILLLALFITTIALLQFSETWITWSREKYSSVFNSFSDNLAGRSYRSRLCMPVPIDIVYTWVNGSDPALVEELRKYRHLMEVNLAGEVSEESEEKKDIKCSFVDCIPDFSVVIDPALPPLLSLQQISLLYPVMELAKDVETIVDPITQLNCTLIKLDGEESVLSVLNSSIIVNGSAIRMRRVHLTSDHTLINSIPSSDIIISKGFPHMMDKDKLKSEFPSPYEESIEDLRLFDDQGVAVLNVKDRKVYDDLLQTTNITINSKALTFRRAYYVWDLKDYSANEDISSSRFADNDELRYSLRSVERYAPWIRHIYIVTNGQIPSWLNLDNPRVSIVTHSELFLNKSHLPTFSSPAIEAHIHRIPGLSQTFIYMNDDVLFGRNVWPDDFLTSSGGQKIYLTWPVPNCRDGCPGSWIKDGYCDKACNNSDCEWDGGDCAGSAGQSAQGGGGLPQGLGGGGGGMPWAGRSSDMYCSTGCADNWIADRYCDQSCNVVMCGYDAGDCGIANYHQFKGLTLSHDISHYYAEGHLIIYFNYSSMVSHKNGSITGGDYDSHIIIRSFAVAQKFKVITLVLKSNVSAVQLNFTLTGEHLPLNKTSYDFSIRVDTTRVDVDNLNLSKNKSVLNSTNTEVQEEVKFEEHTLFKPIKGKKSPVPVKPPELLRGVEVIDLSLFNDSSIIIPEKLRKLYNDLMKQIADDELTEIGVKRASLSLKKAVDDLLSKGEIKVNLNSAQNNKVPDNKVSDNKVSDSKVSDNKVSDSKVSDNKVSGNKVSDSKVSEHKVSDHKVLDNKMSDKKVSDNKMSDNKISDNKLSDNKVLDNKPLPSNIKRLKKNVFNDDIKDENVESIEKVIDSNINNGDIKKVKNLHVGPKRDRLNQPSNGTETRLLQNLGGTRRKLLFNQQSQSESIKLDQDQISSNDDKAGYNVGFLPWERLGLFSVYNNHSRQSKTIADSERLVQFDEKNEYINSENWKGRRLLDTFASSLHHVGRTYNRAYGYMARKVPAHMPHMINRSIVDHMQRRFPVEWDATSSHKIRSGQDMQYAFSYSYFIMSEPRNFSLVEVFDELDVDRSRVLSDRELRILATQLYDLPLDLETLTGFEQMIINCSYVTFNESMNNDSYQQESVIIPKVFKSASFKREVYYDERMPQVTFEFVEDCVPLVEQLKKRNSVRHQYEFQTVGEEDVAFKMIRNNVSSVIAQLDDVRKHHKKFICLNDNIDYTKDSARLVKAVLHDYFESVLPIPSQFELPREYRNKFLHVSELHQWWFYRRQIKFIVQFVLVVLTLFAVLSLCGGRLNIFTRRRVATFR